MDKQRKEEVMTVENLKRKCNFLIDTLSQKEKELEELRQRNISKPRQLQSIGEEPMRELWTFLQEFIAVINTAIEEDAFIPYVYESKHSAAYIKIDCDDFREIVEKTSSLKIEKFLDYCILLQFLGRGAKGKKISYCGNSRVYLISRGIVEYLGTKKEEVVNL